MDYEHARLPDGSCHGGCNWPLAPKTIPLSWLLGAVGFSLVAVVVMMVRLRIAVQVDARLGIFIVLAFSGTVTIRFRFRQPLSRQQRVWRDAAEYYGLFISICVIGALAAYPVAAISTGFADSALERVDHFLRFDWLAWYRFVVEHPAIQWPERAAYQSIFFTPAVLFAYYAWSARRAEARQFILSFWLAAFLTLLLFFHVPAKGPLAFLWHGPLPYVPESALYQADLIPALRSHAAKPIDLGALRGLVAAPSFHAASALLYIAAAWPLRPLRWPVTILNAAMLLATPVEGTHYLVDLIAGAAVALAALAITQLAARRFSPRLASRPQRWKTAQSTISSAE
ncbi:phosphatase PAP2 family protein [Novosphingobium sp. LASN5T]|uniref:phosphatase PAP2 family protein n=1 Tax=Novosphingobium sp. LASN5T TaxID=2491021 RepID=UPI000F5E84B7|nr:phosphatase PAP2 family protein [Novosphingobium sp. LASN5T]RQW40339.1 PAP2 family protein [Novosphingobium sp. LASN5T]